MPPSPTTKAPAAVAFVCDCGESRSVCEGLPFFKEHKGKRYCVLHYPGKDKSSAFNEALKRKLAAEDFDFRGLWFPDFVDFSNFTFTKPVNFYSATFDAGITFDSATFDAGADFYSTKFHAEVSFGLVTFNAQVNFFRSEFHASSYFVSSNFNEDAYFTSSLFKGDVTFLSAAFRARAYFSKATFDTNAYFFNAEFDAEVDFSSTTFSAEINFESAIFRDYVRFAKDAKKTGFGDNSHLSLQFARVEKPDRLSFHTLRLRPHWFVNVDARKFEFINVSWDWRRINTKQEIKSTDKENILLVHGLLAIACWNLAVNAEENHRYHEASLFRYLAMDARRSEGWRSWRNLAYWILHRSYWLASGYGERLRHAVLTLLGIWLFFALLYTQVGFVRWEPRVASEREAAGATRDEVGEPLRWQRALTYSLGVMTLQKPEPRPATNAAQGLVMLETILGPVQAALLALAIRRKFMR